MKKNRSKILKLALGSLFIILILGLVSAYLILDQKMPSGVSGIAADNFALKIQNSIDYEAYKNTDHIQWTFRKKHHYVWHKNAAIVEVKWDTTKVTLNLKNSSESIVYKGQENVQDLETRSASIEQALAYFNNDSFWVIGPYKFFDAGVQRELVTLDNTTKALLIKYSSGGTTPGDSYLWKVDENYIPTGYQMWVSILPIGGLEASWEDWITTGSGLRVAQQHKLLGMEIPITNLKTWND